MLILATFLPFFAMKEIECTFGKEKVRGIFLHGRWREAVPETRTRSGGCENIPSAADTLAELPVCFQVDDKTTESHCLGPEGLLA